MPSESDACPHGHGNVPSIKEEESKSKTPKRARFADGIPSPSSDQVGDDAVANKRRKDKTGDDAVANKRRKDKTGDGPTRTLGHPLGIKPLGNAYLSDTDSKSSAGLFATLPDETIMAIVEELGPDELVQLGRTCKFLYAFCAADEVWRALYLRLSPRRRSDFSWRGSWRRTVLGLDPDIESAVVDCRHVFSDILHRPFQCANVDPSKYAAGIPSGNQIARVSTMTPDEYSSRYVSEPFILTDVATSWPVSKAWSSVDVLVDKFGDVDFRAEAVEWPMREYVKYMLDNADESPLYLFDHGFAEKMSLDGAVDWTPPPCFGFDMFSVLGDDRPHHRWLIVGPKGSGSTFHKDPNGTSAWNAVITGSKYWLMFPSSSLTSKSSSTTAPPPPGVFVSADGSEVTAPLSLAEYLLTFHAEARRSPHAREGICHAGEIVHVPAGWFHMVVNLDHSVAITQNFVPRQNLPDVLDFLNLQPDQVSGFDCEKVKDPYRTFVDGLERWRMEDLVWARGVIERRREAATRWQRAVEPVDGSGGGGFSFGFDIQG